jgi:hypothetical protein
MHLIPDNTKNLSVLASGGIDSTLLLYLIAKQIHEQQLDITVYTISWNLLSGRHALLNKIIASIKERYPVNVIYSNIRRPPPRVRDVAEGALLVTGSEYVFSGCNKVITDKFTPTRYIPGDTPPVRGEPLNSQHLRPFIDMDKIEIVRKYLELDILDLLKLTVSCGISESPECGECYFCQEKIWALKFFKIDGMFSYHEYK